MGPHFGESRRRPSRIVDSAVVGPLLSAQYREPDGWERGCYVLNAGRRDGWSPRRVAIYCCVVLCTLVVTGSLLFFKGDTASWATTSAGVVSALFAVLAVIVAIPSNGPAASRLSTPTQLDEAVRLLRREVRRQWQDESVQRGLVDGRRLPVRWSAFGPPLSDDPATVAAGAGMAGGGRVLRIRLAGYVDDVVPAFQRLAAPRVVVLGAPGSGKSSLLALLTVGLLSSRDGSGPVPVLVTVSSWDPVEEGLYAWLARRITEDYVALGNARAYGQTAVRDLLTDHRLLPVLDGLDEMPIHSRAARAGSRQRLGRQRAAGARVQDR